MYSESMQLVRPEHLNHHGFLFGGRLLEWLDEQSYIAAMAHMKHDANLVTIGIDRVEFHHQVRNGAILQFRSSVVHLGRTSLTVHTDVTIRPEAQTIFDAYVTFVALNKQGRPRSVSNLLLEKYSPSSAEERRQWEIVEAARRSRRVGKGHP